MASLLHLVLLGCFCLPLCSALVRRSAAAYAIGGASSFEQLGPALLKGPCKAVTGKAVYQSVGSGAGIDNFNAGLYATAMSDSPMTIAQEKAGVSGKGKLTLPLILARYSFFVSGAADGLRLTASQTYAIFKFGGAGANPAVPYVPVSRSDSSGTTFVIKRYWKVAKTAFLGDIAASSGIYSTAKFPPTWVASQLTAVQTDGVCKLAAAAPKRITYAQVGVCNTIVPGRVLGEVALQNKAGNYVLASLADASNAVPRQLPAYKASWAAVGEQTILGTGPSTPPVVSFIYGFIPISLKGTGPNGKLGKAIFTCVNKNINTLALKFQFDNTPASLVKKNGVAIAGVKV